MPRGCESDIFVMAGEQTVSWHRYTQMQDMGVAFKQSVYIRNRMVIIMSGPETRANVCRCMLGNSRNPGGLPC